MTPLNRDSILTAALVAVLHCLPVSSACGDDSVDLPPKVASLLNEHCIDCHGPDASEGGLRLDTPVSVLRGGDSGEPTVVPGDSDRSYLIARITAEDPDQRMPPDADPLSNDHVELLRAWVGDTDQWQQPAQILAGEQLDHWAYLPVKRPSVPDVGERHPVDAFVSQQLSEAGLERSSAASRRRLIRRLFLVMHGVPPTPERIDQFLQDTRDDAWERLVDEVLSSRHYGERWATFWLDLIRFAETDGYETNRERPHAWHYRDWVIQAFNDDKPYDRFVIDQLAGDAHGEDVATGFLVAGPHDIVKGQDKALGLMQRQDELDGIINATGATFLGLTLGCARCHNHKFDPVLQADYYALQAVFAGVEYANRTLPPASDLNDQLAVLDEQIAEQRDALLDHVQPLDTPFLLLDDQTKAGVLTAGVEYLVKPTGTQNNEVAGQEGSTAEDSTAEDSTAGRASTARSAAGRTSTVWTPDPQTDVAVWRPMTSGTCRVWLSWGAGAAAHSGDATWWLDGDGDPSTRTDQTLLAEVNQRLTKESGDAQRPSWSGFVDAGIHVLSGRTAIILRSGSTGSSVTADALLLERVSETTVATEQTDRPPVRPPVNAAWNEESFAPVEAVLVRFVINRSSSSQPCLDELEVFSGELNVALASAGAQATSSGDFVHPLHKLVHLNDGTYGNANSWIASTTADAWVQLRLKEPVLIDRIVWSRDRLQKYRDRIPIDYRIEVSSDGEHWKVVASSADRLPTASLEHQIEFETEGLAAAEAQQVQQQVQTLQELISSRAQAARGQEIWAGKFRQPAATYRLYRGDPMAPREQVSPGGVEALTDLRLPQDAPEQQRRLAFAEWVADADNPLTSRVIVNRVWQHHFGTGIVDTPSDFGRNGSEPTHPQLLDWLASEFVRGGWSLKNLHRLILTSATWQQDSVPRSRALTVDAGSRLLWRFPQRRLEAEAIRDSVLAVTGRLNPTAGGPGFSAFEVAMENVRHYFPKETFTEDDWRRMVYMTKVRQERDAVFGTFDCPDCSQLVPARSRSTTPLQAMGLLNSDFMMQQAEFLAERLTLEADDTESRIQRAWELCFGRPPRTVEVELARQSVDDSGWREFARAILNANEFVFIP